METVNVINQKEISKKIGRSQSWVSRALSGKVIPKPDMAAKLAEAMGGKVPRRTLELLWPNGVPEYLKKALEPDPPDTILTDKTGQVMQEDPVNYAEVMCDI